MYQIEQVNPDVIQAIVTRISLAGSIIAVIVYFAVRFGVKPWLTVKFSDRWWHQLATNACTFLLAIGITFLVFFIAFGNDINAAQLIAEAALVSFMAAVSATYGHEVIKNYGKRNETDGAELPADVE